MSDSGLPHGELPPVPDGCGILPVAENRILHGPYSELLDPELPTPVLPTAVPHTAVPQDFRPPAAASCFPAAEPGPSEPFDEPLNDNLELHYRRVLARALALASSALLLTAAVAASLVGNPGLAQSFLAGQLIVRAVFVTQVVILGLCSRYVCKLGMVPAAVLLFAYAAFCGLEFSALLPPATLAAAFLCAGLMYAVTALWGFTRRCDLARPVTAIFMILAGGLILAAVNRALGSSNLTWSLSSMAVVLFACMAIVNAQQIRDYYQDFDDDNAEGWKASVLGALLLLLSSISLYLLAASFLGRAADDRDPTDDLSH